MLDTFLVSLSDVCREILPILGAVALIILCVCLNKLGKVLDQVNERVKEIEPTIKLVDTSIEKLQAPLDTAGKYSHTLDDIHDKAVESAQKVASQAEENMTKAKSVMTDAFQKVTASFNKEEEDEPFMTDLETFNEPKKDPFERDQKIYDDVAKYTAKEEKK